VNEREFSQRLRRRARRVQLAVTDDLAAALWIYFDLLFRWNRKINLTSLSLDHPEEAVDRLLIEPLLASKQEPSARGSRLLDIGSGGGSPAIPLMLSQPGVRLVMVESKARKSAFLREVLRHLGADGSVETARFEELLTKPEFHEAFDTVTIRAVRAEAKTLLRIQAFVRAGGRILLFRARQNAQPPDWAAPPLAWRATHTLGDSAQLVVLAKLAIP
jgi:16S rRNA (guanine527-N7)-methyltransferase